MEICKTVNIFIFGQVLRIQISYIWFVYRERGADLQICFWLMIAFMGFVGEVGEGAWNYKRVRGLRWSSSTYSPTASYFHMKLTRMVVLVQCFKGNCYALSKTKKHRRSRLHSLPDIHIELNDNLWCTTLVFVNATNTSTVTTATKNMLLEPPPQKKKKVGAMCNVYIKTECNDMQII